MSVVTSVTQIDELISKISSMKRLRRIVAWILRFRTVLRTLVQQRGGTFVTPTSGPLQVHELHAAEKALVQHVQRSSYTEEWELLNNGKSTRPSSQLKSLTPIFVNGLIKVGGRLQYAPISESQRHPTIIPGKHALTKAIIREMHEDNGHAGCDHVLNTLRQMYWVPRGKSIVKSVLHECRLCRRHKAPTCQQQMAPLIKEQVTPDSPPFTNVGVDCFGPMLVKCRRSTVKRWGCIFTCLAIRAIHIEVLHSMNTDSFISAFRRFQNRRGDTANVYSDQGTNFIGGERELREALEELDHNEIATQLAKHGADWHFNPPMASHRGGATERMIRSVRQVLSTAVGAQVLNDEQLLTVFTEAERCVNSRPLTSVISDARDMRALTPSMLLTLRNHDVTMPPGIFDENDNIARRWWRQAQYISDIFWQRWVKEYLVTLHERQRWQHVKRSLQVGDIVLMNNVGTPRCQWPLARVVKVCDSRDGHVRSVEVINSSGRVFTRPVTRLCLLETD